MNYLLLQKLPQSFIVTAETFPDELFSTLKTAPSHLLLFQKPALMNYSLLQEIAASHLLLLQKPIPINYSLLRKLPQVIYYYSRNLPL